MTALRGKEGQTLAFLTEGGRILSLKGKSLAWISGAHVYKYTGDHIGWWTDGHVRGPDGGVLAWQTGATNLGVIPPTPASSPIAPVPSIEPTRLFRALRRSDRPISRVGAITLSKIEAPRSSHALAPERSA